MKVFICGDIAIKKIVSCGPKLKKIMNECDTVIGNLEGPILEEGEIEGKMVPKTGPHIINDVCVCDFLKENKFNMITLANNHIMDYGTYGLNKTLKRIREISEDIDFAGAGFFPEDIYKYVKSNINGISVAFISVAEKQFGMSEEGRAGYANAISYELFRLIEDAKHECDYVIIICHMGLEEVEVPLPEVRNLYKSYIDYGADIVVGGHTHTIQGHEIYKGKHIFYSLGNFAFLDENEQPYSPESMCVVLEIDENGINADVHITWFDGNCVEVIDNYDRYDKASSILLDKNEYEKKVDDICINWYFKYFRKYYAMGVGLNIESEVDVKKFANYRLNGEPIKWDDLYIYAIVTGDVCRWVCNRAVRLIMKL